MRSWQRCSGQREEWARWGPGRGVCTQIAPRVQPVLFLAWTLCVLPVGKPGAWRGWPLAASTVTGWLGTSSHCQPHNLAGSCFTSRKLSEGFTEWSTRQWLLPHLPCILAANIWALQGSGSLGPPGMAPFCPRPTARFWGGLVPALLGACMRVCGAGVLPRPWTRNTRLPEVHFAWPVAASCCLRWLVFSLSSSG